MKAERGDPGSATGRPPRWTIVVAIVLVVVLAVTSFVAVF